MPRPMLCARCGYAAGPLAVVVPGPGGWGMNEVVLCRACDEETRGLPEAPAVGSPAAGAREPEELVETVLGGGVLVRWEDVVYGAGAPAAPGLYPARVVGLGTGVPDGCGFERGERVLAARRREALEWWPTATRALSVVPLGDVVAVLTEGRPRGDQA